MKKPVKPEQPIRFEHRKDLHKDDYSYKEIVRLMIDWAEELKTPVTDVHLQFETEDVSGCQCCPHIEGRMYLTCLELYADYLKKLKKYEKDLEIYQADYLAWEKHTKDMKKLHENEKKIKKKIELKERMAKIKKELEQLEKRD